MPLALDKRSWHPSPLPGQIVLVTTVGPDGTVDVAPKSWVSMVSLAGPVLGFGCSTLHRTYANIEATGEFVVNVAPSQVAAEAWSMLLSHGPERLDRSGLTLAPASRVSPPVVLDCVAFLECRLIQTTAFADEVFIFGSVVAGAIAEECLGGDMAARYRALDPCFYLEEGVYAGLSSPMTAPA